jgi:hypothetical protein
MKKPRISYKRIEEEYVGPTVADGEGKAATVAELIRELPADERKALITYIDEGAYTKGARACKMGYVRYKNNVRETIEKIRRLYYDRAT